MKIDFTKFEGWELTKAIYLVQNAKELGMKLDSYGEIAVNQNSGYTYLWSEDYPFTLFMPINCKLIKSDIGVLFSDFVTGEEIEKSLTDFKDLNDIYLFAEDLEINKN